MVVNGYKKSLSLAMDYLYTWTRHSISQSTTIGLCTTFDVFDTLCNASKIKGHYIIGIVE